MDGTVSDPKPAPAPQPARAPEPAAPPREPAREVVRKAVRPRRKRRGRWIALAAALLLIGGGVAWYAMPESGSGASGPPTVEVVQGNVSDVVSALGIVQPVRYVDVGAQVSGQLQRIHVRIGDRVEQGQLLAEIDPRVYQSRERTDSAELQRLQGVLRQQQAQRALAEAQARRQQTLLSGNATSRDAFDIAQANVRVLDAQMAQTQAQISGQEAVLAADRTNLSFTRIVAPMAGTVVTVPAVEGQTLNANQSAPIILRIADLSTMTVWTQVSEADQPKIEVGMPVRFNTLGRPERQYESTLRQIYPTPDVLNNVVLYNALFDVPNQDGALLPQMSAQVFFVRAAAENVTIVPVAALLPGRGDPARRFVRVVTPAGIERRAVTVGVSDRVNAEVRAGLAPGERVALPNAGAAPEGTSQQRPQRPRTPRL